MARQERLIGVVESLSAALAHSGLVGRSTQGRVGVGLHKRERGRLLTGVAGGRRVMKRMVKGRTLMKESSRKLGGGSCIIVGDFFLRSNQKNSGERHF